MAEESRVSQDGRSNEEYGEEYSRGQRVRFRSPDGFGGMNYEEKENRIEVVIIEYPGMTTAVLMVMAGEEMSFD